MERRLLIAGERDADQSLLQATIQPVWHLVRQVRLEVGEALASFSADLRTAAMIAASELLENAIKYGESLPQAPAIEFSMVTRRERLCIRTVNGCTNLAGVRELAARVNEVSSTPDRASLYQARLEYLLTHPGDSGKLGLYRIGFEAEFDLESSYQNEVVTVTATRKLP
jgi:anti-sigma regulatory factor (Ser/Thr protein kinase)